MKRDGNQRRFLSDNTTCRIRSGNPNGETHSTGGRRSGRGVNIDSEGSGFSGSQACGGTGAERGSDGVTWAVIYERNCEVAERAVSKVLNRKSCQPVGP